MKYKQHYFGEEIKPIKDVEHTKAYWISPSGEIISVPMKHIDMVREDPTQFGLSQEYVDDMIEKHGKLYDGSKSRDAIMTRLMEDGWVRIRKVDSRQAGSFWTVQLDAKGNNIPRVAKNNVVNWAMSMLNSGDKYKNQNVIALNLKGERLFGGNTPQTWKTLQDVVLDDTGVFESVDDTKDVTNEI